LSAQPPPITEDELDALRQVGRKWATAMDGRRRLPLDPTLRRRPEPPRPSRFGRFAPVEMFRPEAPDELVATESAVVPESSLGRALTGLRRVILGPPLDSAAVVHERMRKLVALPVLSADLLSSVAYGPEAMLGVLVLGGSAALGLSLPIAAVLVALMIAVGVSYRQTLRAYPHGAGSYIVAGDNLGARSGLAAAAGLMMDYVLTVSVSVSAGTDAITSALPMLHPWVRVIGPGMILVLLAGNLRGVRAAGNLFAAPTYAFVLAIALLLAFGIGQAGARGFVAVPPPPIPATEGIGILLVLRAFTSGASSMTGIEAVSNAVPVFQPVEWRNARTTLTWMISLLVVMFAGLTMLIHFDGVVPRPNQTVLSQLAHRTFPGGPVYGFIQASTALILLFAANTAFNDFPRLLFYLARDRYAPRGFLRIGDRLAFSNGIIVLGVVAAVIFVAFGGRTESLVPLYAVGVFLAFTLSQAGMVVHWWRRRGARWAHSLVLNALGALLSALVLVTAAVTKFTGGAWVVVLAIPLLILMASRIRRHYDIVHAALSVRPVSAVLPAPSRAAVTDPEHAATPQQVRHLIVVPVVRLDLGALRALAYAASLGQPLFAVHISTEEQEAQWFRQQWDAWGDHLRLEIIVSPYRAVVAPLAHYLKALRTLRPDLTLTVILPEIVVRHWWHQALHTHTALRLRRAFRPIPSVVITSVPIHVPDSAVQPSGRA
jgi:amino acid transporter